MRILFVSMGAENRASSRLRVYGWLPHLEAAGHTCQVLPYHSVATSTGEGWVAARSPRFAAWAAGPALWREIEAAAEGIDWVVFQEVLPPPKLLDRLGGRGVRIGFDFSDPVHLANGPDHKVHHRLIHRLTTLPRFRAMLEAAEWATIENRGLKEMVAATGTRVEAFCGPVDADIYLPAERTGGDTVVVGWAGSFGTLPFLDPVLPILGDLARGGLPIELVVFGVKDAVSVPGVPVRVIPWTLEAEPSVIAGFDIGLAYLPDTPWTRFRGGAKLVLYQSCGVPTVASPTGIGSQVIRDGVTGLLADGDAEWAQALEVLIADSDRRARMGAAARQDAVSCYSYRAYLPTLLQLLAGPPAGVSQIRIP